MPCVDKFMQSLKDYEVEQETIDAIFCGFENITCKSSKKERAAFFKQATDIMDERMDSEKKTEILLWNACCKSGARDKKSREFRRINANISLSDKLQKIEKAPYMNMGRPELNEEGQLLIHAVNYLLDDKYECGCSNFNRVKRDYVVSKNYCICCAGHFQYHYEIMLDVKLKLVKVVSSPLDSNGVEPCAFLFDLLS